MVEVLAEPCTRGDSAKAPRRIRAAASGVVGLLALAPIATYLWIALHQVSYPYELEWMEGGAVEVVGRVLHGQGLYGSPSLQFVPWPYTPLYWWVSAGVAQATGLGFFALRLVSLVASLATLALIALVVRAETRSWVAGVASAGIYSATYRLSGDWFAIGRNDSLMLFLLLAAVALGARARSWRAGMATGALAFLAFFTKQSALVAILPPLAYLFVTRWRVAVTTALTLGALVGLSTVAMDMVSGGWYRYYVFEELAHQGVTSTEWTQFWSRDLRPLWLAGAFALVVLVVRVNSRWAYYGAACAGMLAASWISRLHNGGSSNVLMPAFAGMALLAGLALGTTLRPRQGASANPQGPRHAMAALGASGLILAQLALLRYPVAAQIPTKADAAAGNRLLTQIKALPGRVVVLDHPWYATIAAKGTFADGEAMHDVLRAGPSKARSDLSADLATALSTPQIGAIVLDGNDDDQDLRARLRAGFKRVPLTWDPGSSFYPVVGDLATRPQLLFVRSSVQRNGAGA